MRKLSEEFIIERDNLLKNYEKLIYFKDDLIIGEEVYLLIERYATTHLVPSQKFIRIFMDRVDQIFDDEIYNTGLDQDDYDTWALAAGIDDGENFIYDLDIFEWFDYYGSDFYKTQ